MDAKDAVRSAGGRTSLIGSLNYTETLLMGTPEAVETQASEAVEIGVQVLGPECAVSLRTPLHNLKARRRAVKSYC